MSMDQYAMQPDPGHEDPTRERAYRDPTQSAVASRRWVLEQLQAAVDVGENGPLLITGESGAGKTWLAGRLVDRLPAGWRAVSVDLTSTLDAREFLRLVADALGLPMTERIGLARLRIRAALEDDLADRRRWLLIVDQVQSGSRDVWEEIHTLADSLGHPGGFASMLVLGRTEFARDLATRRLNAWAMRMSLHVHLTPLDLDEARDLLAFQDWAGCAEELTPYLEALHRDALGNPRQLLQLARRRAAALQPNSENEIEDLRGRRSGLPGRSDDPGSRIARRAERTDASLTRDGIASSTPASAPARAPSLIPARPPIRLEEGLVEVGWDGDLEPELTRAEGTSPSRQGSSPVSPDLNEQLVDDHFAAMQAWTEWSRNRERSANPDEPPLALDPSETEAASAEGSVREGRAGDNSPPSTANIRAGGPHEFAPYSQLFTRLRQSKQG